MFRTARRQGIRAPPYGGGRHVRVGIRIWRPRERTAQMVVHVHGAKRPNTGRWCRALSRTNLVLGIVSSRGGRIDEIGIDLYSSGRNHQGTDITGTTITIYYYTTHTCSQNPDGKTRSLLALFLSH